LSADTNRTDLNSSLNNSTYGIFLEANARFVSTLSTTINIRLASIFLVFHLTLGFGAGRISHSLPNDPAGAFDKIDRTPTNTLYLASLIRSWSCCEGNTARTPD
jgi:hypothetical protein